MALLAPCRLGRRITVLSVKTHVVLPRKPNLFYTPTPGLVQCPLVSILPTFSFHKQNETMPQVLYYSLVYTQWRLLPVLSETRSTMVFLLLFSSSFFANSTQRECFSWHETSYKSTNKPFCGRVSSCLHCLGMSLSSHVAFDIKNIETHNLNNCAPLSALTVLEMPAELLLAVGDYLWLLCLPLCPSPRKLNTIIHHNQKSHIINSAQIHYNQRPWVTQNKIRYSFIDPFGEIQLS